MVAVPAFSQMNFQLKCRVYSSVSLSENAVFSILHCENKGMAFQKNASTNAIIKFLFINGYRDVLKILDLGF